MTAVRARCRGRRRWASAAPATSSPNRRRRRRRVQRRSALPFQSVGQLLLRGAARCAASGRPNRCRCRPGAPRVQREAERATAITIALRVPILANCCGPPVTGIETARISSSGSSALRLTPGRSRRSRDEPHAPHRLDLDGGARRPAAVDARHRRARPTRGCRATVPRLRICGEPTVREAIASPGSRSASSACTCAYVHARAHPEPVGLRPRPDLRPGGQVEQPRRAGAGRS